MKEKRKREREKNLPRKKRRKLQAAREMLDDEDLTEKPESIWVYRRGKRQREGCAPKKAMGSAGKIVQKKASKKSKQPPERTQSRTEEMQELFQSDMSEKKQKRRSSGTGNRKSTPRIHSKANQEEKGEARQYRYDRLRYVKAILAKDLIIISPDVYFLPC
uniref:Uncharacterized protein n=1 Tax=Populus alba TaxID=43335 RepID=A0A4U5Q1C6_POPAL|nr:hypothetical protein D5086_0000152490 [Populus alba]